MPNFTVAVTGTGKTVEVWSDPIVGTLPSRLNASTAHPHRYYQALQNTGPITITATVGGVSGPLDAALAGDTFSTSILEVPTFPAPAISSPAGQSSVASFTPTQLGLHFVVMRRINGGAVGVHIYVEEAA